jgi:hypothetical protein
MELKLHAIKVNKGYYISDNTKYELYHGSYIDRLYFDGELPKKSFHKDWFFIDKYPEKIEELGKKEIINKRYELIDSMFLSDKVPAIFNHDEVTYKDEEGDYYWKDEYKKLQSLYEYKCDLTEPEMVSVNFEIEVILEVDSDYLREPGKISFNAIGSSIWRDRKFTINNSDVAHQLLDRIMTPSILLHETPCSLSSEQVYNILRQYIKENIDIRYAKITSDYAFCMTIEKNIMLAKPYTVEQEVTKSNGHSYRPKKINKKFINNRQVKVFEMTYSPENYKGYTPIQAVFGENEADLADKMEILCHETIEMINEPLVDCQHCGGTGVCKKE